MRVFLVSSSASPTHVLLDRVKTDKPPDTVKHRRFVRGFLTVYITGTIVYYSSTASSFASAGALVSVAVASFLSA